MVAPAVKGPKKPDDVASLVVSFLQGIYKDNPTGLGVKDFQKKFPDICQESETWWLDYGYQTMKEALEAISPTHVVLKFNTQFQTWFVSLNPRSPKIDKDIMELILGQRAKPKKKRPMQSRPNRALASFNMNRQWAGKPSYNQSQYNNRRLNQGRNDSFIYSKPPEPARLSAYSRPSYSNANSFAAPYDPRASRGYSSSTSITRPSLPPQGPLRSPTTTQPSQAFRPSSQTPSKSAPYSGTSHNSSTRSTSPPRHVPPQPSPPAAAEPIVRRRDKDRTTTKTVDKIPDDEQTIARKSHIRQRLVFLLTRRHSEVKLLHLKNLYSHEFQEELNPEEFGYKSIAELVKDPQISVAIKLNVKSPAITISMRDSTPPNGKENVNTEATCADDNCNGLTKYQKKVDAIEPFNLKSMYNSLEPLKESTDSYLNMSSPCEEVIKYKTLRIVFKSPGSALPLDDWEMKYEQETRLRIRARDFGYKTTLEFFKALQEDAPIRVDLNDNSDFIAHIVREDLQNWVNAQLTKGLYRSMMAMDSLYEIVAMPDDLYSYNKLDDLIQADCHPISILSAKDYESMWIRLKEAKHIEAFLSIEASMTCYEDYKQKGLLKVPLQYVKPGFPCAVHDPSQKRWCRGLVLKAPDTVDKNYMIEVLLVDYGVTKQVAISEMLCILKTHQSREIGPIYSRLLGVVDKGMPTKSISTKAHSRMVLQEYTNPPVKLACKVVRRIAQTDIIPKHMPRYIAEISLFDTRRSEDVIIADLINVDGDSPDAAK